MAKPSPKTPAVAVKKPTKSSTKAGKYVYYFGKKRGADGNRNMKDILGGKGANLAEMINLKIPVPPGFTIGTNVCTHFYANDKKFPQTLEKQVEDAILKLEKELNKKFGDKNDPLLVSVRSGARASMPGMMDTILNLGLTDTTVQALAKQSGNPRFAYDSYRRLISMYGDVVLEMKPATKEDHDPFDEILDKVKSTKGYKTDAELNTDDLKGICKKFLEIIKAKGKTFPQDPKKQL